MNTNTAINWLFLALLLCIPLGIWKLIEILVWLCSHIHLGIN